MSTAGYAENEDLTFDKDGTPALKRLAGHYGDRGQAGGGDQVADAGTDTTTDEANPPRRHTQIRNAAQASVFKIHPGPVLPVSVLDPTDTDPTPQLHPVRGLLRLAGHGVALHVPVHRRARHPEQVRDLLDGLVPRVVQLLGEGGLVGGELGPASVSRVAFSVSPSRSSLRTRSRLGREALAPLALSRWMSSRSTPARSSASIWWSGALLCGW
jgi:hypothetical protein